jgi:hypothetical protein
MKSSNTCVRISKLLFTKATTTFPRVIKWNFQNSIHCPFNSNSKSLYLGARALSHQTTPPSISNTSIQSKPPNILHKKAFVRRTFSPNSNAQALLVSGGEGLAANASFDPEYSRVKNYIRNRPVGPAVLSPILIQGLIGALVEATLPQSFFVENRLKQIRPLIVGVEVEASIEIVSVLPSTGRGDVFEYDDGVAAASREEKTTSDNGYKVNINATVHRVSDGQLIAEGEQIVWLPDFCLENNPI